MPARSCCDPSDLIDLNSVSLDDPFRFFVDAAKVPFLLIDIVNDFDLTMEGIVDHLRLPASSDLQIRFDDLHLWKAVFIIIFNPLIWNLLGRLEHKYRPLTRLCFNKPKLACFFLALLILLLGVVRTHHFNIACHTQPSWIILRQNRVLILGYFSCIIGSCLVITSFYQLGFFATFLGDYFGIVSHSAPVTAFPFSLTDDPMYWGSTINFLGLALVKSSPAGCLLAVLVGLVYRIALIFETQFTRDYYSTFDVADVSDGEGEEEEVEGEEEEERKERDDVLDEYQKKTS